MSHVPESVEVSAGRPRRAGTGAGVTILVIVGLIVVLGFAPLSALIAGDLPTAPTVVSAHLTGPTRAKITAVQQVPVGLVPSARIRTPEDVLPYAIAALGEPGARALMAVLTSSNTLASSPVGYQTGHTEYPYRYPTLDVVLDQAPPASFLSGATALGAALTVLSIAPNLADLNASAAAYGVLNRARVSGQCAPQLDLFLLLTADELTTSDILGREEQRTESTCPHDPTPGWLLGQSQLRRVPLSLSATFANAGNRAPLQAAIATFTRLAGKFPEDVGVLTGLGDAYLRDGTHVRSSQPFTARQSLISAITEYNRASALGAQRDAALGMARALVGLGEPAEAARLLQPSATASTQPGPVLEMLIAADEAAHDFGAAQVVARRLDQLGNAGYPDGIGLFPTPTGNFLGSLDDASLPLSFGADRLTSLQAVLVAPGGAGGSLQDLSFVPEYRDDLGLTGSQPDCASWTWRRDMLLSGHPAQALDGWPANFVSGRPNDSGCSVAPTLKLLVETAAGRQLDRTSSSSDDVADAHQNLLRWAGDLTAARAVAEKWQSARGNKSAMPALRLGEIDFLSHQYNDAAAEFGLAARRSRLVAPKDDLAVDEALLDRGAALLAAGRTTEGTQLLRPLDQLGTQGYAYQNSLSEGSDDAVRFATVSYFACEQLGDYERESGDLAAAVEHYTTALDWTQQVEEGTGVRPEVLNNNAALAYLGLGDTTTAASLEAKALASDPMDPAFLMTAGFIADRAGDVAAAQRYDRRSLDSDPGAFPAANDLAVELSREHHDGAAVTALRQAVGASPDYALGWFNLGVRESKLGPAHVLAAQGALAKAYALDPALKDRRRDMTIDASVYRTALDLSKPLPPRWSFSQLQRPVPVAAAGLLAVVVLAVGLAKASGRGGTEIADQWLDPVAERLDTMPLQQRLRHPAWALAATCVTFVLAYLRRGIDPTEIVLYAVGVLVLAGTATSARGALGRVRGVAVTQRSWLPGMVFGMVAGAIGLPWAPLPVLATDGEDAPQLHLAAPVSLAALSLLLFVQSAWLHTPITGSWAIAALIMSASTLLPVGPLDGAHVGKAGIVAGAGVVGGALLVGLGLI